MECLKGLLTRKRVLRSNLTKLKAKIENYHETDSAQFEQFREKTKDIAEKTDEVFNSIFELCNEEELEQFIEESQSVQDTIDDLNLILIRLRVKVKDKPNDIDISSVNKQLAEVKLPKLTLPIFSGNLDEWLSFCDLFQASVKNNDRLSAAQKLQYLKGSLKGDALKLVQSFSITDANFEIAWELLCERFSNKRELVFSVIRKIMYLPSIHIENAANILHIVDTVKECMLTLENLEQKIEHFSDTLLVFIIQIKLDPVTRSWWERTLKNDNIPTIDQLLEFLKCHARMLQNSRMSQPKRQVFSKVTSLASEFELQCILCSDDHLLFKCPKFLKLSVQNRVNLVKEKKLCFNCLSQNHSANLCKSIHKCKRCNKPHHTVLHYERVINHKCNNKFRTSMKDSGHLSAEAIEFSPKSTFVTNTMPTEKSKSCENRLPFSHTNSEKDVSPAIASCFSDFNLHQVLLCTAKIKIRDSTGQFQFCRALLDPGSQASFITENCIHRLGLSRKRAKIQVSCLGSTGVYTNGVTELQFTSHYRSNPVFTATAFVMNKIIGDLPHHSLDPDQMDCYSDLTLADPTFFKSGPIDILLGVSVSLPMFKGETIVKGKGLPCAIRSELGWIISGTFNSERGESSHIFVNNIQLDTDQLVQSFWELESVPPANLLTIEEQACEEHFLRTFSRDDNGRFIVRLPFHSSTALLGDSRQNALRRFKGLENKLSLSAEKYQQYRDFMKEYQDLGHMERVSISEETGKTATTFYLPHHAVVKESSTTTKLRVVFDASAKSSSGVSLNDILMVGPRVQHDLFSILLRFRTFRVAICADVTKMFRQIKVHPEDADFQRILWRGSPEEPLSEFRLLTVTYGTTSAPFLATRALKQLALDEARNYPLASRATLRDFYVDDLLSGAQSVEEARNLTNQLRNMMNSGGFPLCKWSSNVSSVLETIPEELREVNLPLKIDNDKAVRVLGINWHPCSDTFEFSVAMRERTEKFTKRSILSELARIFDPMGWLAPTVILAKIFLQELWRYDISWDEPISESLESKWRIFYNELTIISDLRIDRYVLVPDPSHLQLYAFCDASEKAYCAVIYVRSVSLDSDIKVSLLAAKTRVAPLKMQSLPRLELCAALLLANLLEVVLKHLEIPVQDTFAWTDSQVALAWICSEPRRWQAFVANRVSRIQQAIPGVQWNYVKGSENPADCATRGLLPSELIKCETWFKGPDWLKKPSEKNSSVQDSEFSEEEILKEERRHIVTATTCTDENTEFLSYSSWIRLCHITTDIV